MHAASQLFVEAFDVQVDGERVSPDAVFPDWSPLDRFGIVVTEPLGGLGASLLLQLAIAMFYSVRPDRRAGTPVYPEVYLFHVGGPHGDFSNFDLEKTGSTDACRRWELRGCDTAFRLHVARTAEIDAIEKCLPRMQLRNDASSLRKGERDCERKKGSG